MRRSSAKTDSPGEIIPVSFFQSEEARFAGGGHWGIRSVSVPLQTVETFCRRKWMGFYSTAQFWQRLELCVCQAFNRKKRIPSGTETSIRVSPPTSIGKASATDHELAARSSWSADDGHAI